MDWKTGSTARSDYIATEICTSLQISGPVNTWNWVGGVIDPIRELCDTVTSRGT